MTALGRIAPPDASDGQRCCPACGTCSEIGPTEDLWPLGWTCRACRYALPGAGGFAQLAAALDETNEGFDLESFAALAAISDGHFWFESRNELIRWLVHKYASSARRVLEIGCGTGFVLSALRQALPAAKISGSELHSRGLVAARQRHGRDVELIQMDARQSHLRDALDLVGAFDVLEHIAEDSGVLSGIARMLKPGGILIATVPQHPWLWSTSDDHAHHHRRYRRGELAEKAQAAGLKPLYQSSFTTLAFPTMVAARLVARRRSPENLSEYQLRLHPVANWALLRLARFEHGLRRAGLPLPFGGSQILVACRP